VTETRIRQAGRDDLEALAEVFEDRHFLEDRLHRQEHGLGALLSAWQADRPVGILYLWLEKAEEEDIAEHLPGVPVLNHLEVVADLRGEGIGSLLLAQAEARLAADHAQVVLAVRTDNKDATRLYHRLGYRDWGHGQVVCFAETAMPDGEIFREEEKCYVLVKDLKAAPLRSAVTADASARC
jgi:ribosomal protein S18 acetylase RimI-like enzyme